MNIFRHVFVVAVIHFTKANFESSQDNDPYQRKYGNVIHVSAVRNKFFWVICTKKNFTIELSAKALNSIIQIFRHGDRSTIFPYPKDPHREHRWPDGHGQLMEVSVETTKANSDLMHQYSWWMQVVGILGNK